MDSSTHPLLVPRFKVIADYPKSIHKVGTIYECGGSAEDLLYCDRDGPRMRDYPHLFESLPWYAERRPEEMPEYVKYTPVFKDGSVVCYKVDEWIMYEMPLGGQQIGFQNNGGMIGAHCLEPITEAEYNAYLQSQTK